MLCFFGAALSFPEKPQLMDRSVFPVTGSSSQITAPPKIGCSAQSTIKSDLKQSEEFEDNYDNDNYSDYIEDSVHIRDSYQSKCGMASIIQSDWMARTILK